MLHSPEMSKELQSKGGALLVWLDMTKLGKMTGKELDRAINSMCAALRLQPTTSVGFLTAPVLVSAQASSSREEMRRVEDKMDMKQLSNHLVCLRMEVPPSTKKVPLTFFSWIVMDSSTEASNIFRGCQLYADKCGGQNY